MKHLLPFLSLLGLCTSLQAEAGSARLYGQEIGAGDATYLAARYLTPPDAAFDVAYQISPELPQPADFGDAALVVIASLNEKSGTPWTDEQAAQAHQWVERGGTLIFLGNAPLVLSQTAPNLGSLSALLGAGRGQSPKGRQVVSSDSPLTTGLKSAPWMEPGGWALTELNGAQSLLSDGSAALAIFHRIGEGTVYFFGRDVTRLTSQTGIVTYGNLIGSAMLASKVLKAPSKREPWKLEALAGEIETTAVEPMVKQQLAPTWKSEPVQGAPVSLASGGKAQAVIIVPDSPSAAAREAANLLKTELEKVTGAEFSVVKESQLELTPRDDGGRDIRTRAGESFGSAIVVGETKLGQACGVTSFGLPYEGYRILTKGNLLILCGSDRKPDGFALDGTRFAAITFLERFCGVRWLWPGDLGSIHPLTPSLAVGPIDATDAPALRIRKLRDMGGGSKRFETDPATGRIRGKNSGRRAETSIALLQRDLETHLQRHDVALPWFDLMRTGQSYLAGASHAYAGWWDRSGAKDPGWFSLQPTGRRTQKPPREQFCQSAPGLATAMAEEAVRKFTKDPQHEVVSIAPNDVGVNSYCFCEACRKKDPVNGQLMAVRSLIGGVSFFSLYPALSDRMTGFFAEVAREVDRLRPGAKVGVTAYSAFRPAPLAARLPANSLLVFVGTNYFDQFILDNDRRNWDGWASHAGEMILRPNTLHQGHAMPAVFVKRLSRDLKHCYQTGMIGADYDSIVHHWATQGLNYYVLAKLLWDPSQDVEAIVQDYCKNGFGPAAGTIREYFAALEEHTDKVATRMGELSQAKLKGTDEDDPEAPVGAEFFIQQIPDLYRPQTLDAWAVILARAKGEAAGDEKILARITFLEDGLRYARMQHDFFLALRVEKEQSPVLRALAEKRRAEFQRLFDENYHAVGFANCVWREEYFWKQAGITLPPKP